MKQCSGETIPPDAARALIEVASLVIRSVRGELGRGQPTGLTYSQIRALGTVDAFPGASLAEAAEHLGLQAPTTSKVMDELVRQGLVERQVAPGDRRRVALFVTPRGREALEAAAEPALARVAELMAQLAPADREAVERAVELLRPLFLPPAPRAGEPRA